MEFPSLLAQIHSEHIKYNRTTNSLVHKYIIHCSYMKVDLYQQIYVHVFLFYFGAIKFNVPLNVAIKKVNSGMLQILFPAEQPDICIHVHIHTYIHIHKHTHIHIHSGSSASGTLCVNNNETNFTIITDLKNKVDRFYANSFT